MLLLCPFLDDVDENSTYLMLSSAKIFGEYS